MKFIYSSRWFKSATDSQLKLEREKVRLAYANAGRNRLSDTETDRLYFLLKKFDREIGNRAWAGKKASGPVHREHGWYLPNDE